MGRAWAVASAQQTFKPRTMPRSLPTPANDNVPKAKPMGVMQWPAALPSPANDNSKGARIPKVKPARIPRYNAADAIGVRRAAVIGAVGIVPGFLNPLPIPAVFLGAGGFYSYCAAPNGYGGPFSSGAGYFPQGTAPGNPRVQKACLDLQALVGGADGFPDPGPFVGANFTRIGYWRYTNLDQNRYTHLWSIQNGRKGWIMPTPLPSARIAGASVPKPPELPKPPKGKEQKFKFTGPIRTLVDFTTEVGDVVDCLFDGLPGKVKAGAYRQYKGRLGKGAKAMYAYDHFHAIDWARTSQCMAANQVEDFVYGKLGKFTARANQRLGRFTGVATGPAL